MNSNITVSECAGCPDALLEEWYAERYRDTRLPCSECGQWWDFAPQRINRPPQQCRRAPSLEQATTFSETQFAKGVGQLLRLLS